jgi:DNA polymerase-3 subunit epsilon
MTNLPATIVAFDVETTGLRSNDRVVSLGAWRVRSVELFSQEFAADCLHIIVDPGKPSHPRAQLVHGYSDWDLQHQRPFAEHASLVKDFLLSGDVVVAHNAGFDLSFLDREYVHLGERIELPCYCTMSGYRQSGATGRASLNAICNEIGLKRIGERHGALEDAWLALMVYFWLNHAPSEFIQPFAKVIEKGIPLSPFNYRAPPPRPAGPLAPARRQIRTLQVRELAAARKEAKERLSKAVRPSAVLMLEVARASDSLAAEEIDILVDLIQSTRTRLGMPVDNEVEFEVLADIFEINVTQNQLTRCARAVYEDEGARADFPRWFAAMATADGSVSNAERAAIERVKSAIRRVLPKQ